MFDSTNIDVRGGNSSASSKSTATASISTPIAVKPANELTRFIRVRNDSPEVKTRSWSLPKHDLVVKLFDRRLAA